MNMRCLYIIVALFSVLNTLHAQQTSEAVAEKLQTQLAIFPQEKLYLHLDKAVYAPGEQIQFRAYLADASSHCPVNKSQYVYIELINPENSVLSKVRVAPDSLGLFYGYLPIPTALDAGEYDVRAYTMYMNNKNNAEYLFRKHIQIVTGYSADSGKQRQKADSDGQSFLKSEQEPEDETGFSLDIRHSADHIMVSVSQPGQTEYPADSLFLLIHTRGQLQYWGSWDPQQAPLLFDRKSLPSGISQIILLDAQNRKISERLISTWQNDLPQVTMTAEKAEKGTVTLHFSIRTDDTISATDYCSVAVTAGESNQDSTSGIASSLLFTSDQLMNTQEWKRYDIANLLNNRYISPTIPYEALSPADEGEGKIKIFDIPDTDMMRKKASKASKDFSRYEQYCSYSLHKHEIEKKQVTRTDELLTYLPGMLAYRNYFQNLSRADKPAANPCLVVFNDQLMQPYFDINQIEPSSITSIGVISGPQMAVFGKEGAPVLDRQRMTATPKHALVISTRDIASMHVASVHKGKNTVSNKENTVILYWNPAVKADKEFSVSFDIPEQVKSYHVVMEGLLHNGKIISWY